MTAIKRPIISSQDNERGGLLYTYLINGKTHQFNSSDIPQFSSSTIETLKILTSNIMPASLKGFSDKLVHKTKQLKDCENNTLYNIIKGIAGIVLGSALTVYSAKEYSFKNRYGINTKPELIMYVAGIGISLLSCSLTFLHFNQIEELKQTVLHLERGFVERIETNKWYLAFLNQKITSHKSELSVYQNLESEIKNYSDFLEKFEINYQRK